MNTCHWEVTSRCNLSCLHCIYGGVIYEELNTARAFQAIECMRDSGGELLCITGGEPLVRKDFIEILGKSCEMGLTNALITNGTLLDIDFIDRAEQYLTGVCFSIDGLGSVHDKLRGNGCFDLAVKAMDLVQGYSHIHVSASVTVTALNIATIFDTLQWLIERGLSIHINDLNVMGNVVANRDMLELDWNAETRNVLFEAMTETSGTKEIASNSACSVSEEVVCMSCDGQIYLCSELMTARRNPSGSIFDEDIESRLRSQCSSIGSYQCKYTDYSTGTISATLYNGNRCPLTRGGVY